ncbi:MAG: hypothetical protein AAB358_03695 [Patescibacteria group bacterium]
MKNKKLLYGILGAILVLLVAVGVILFLEQKNQTATEKFDLILVKNQYVAELMAIDGVVGVGIGECWGELCLKVYLENNSSELKRQIPKQLDGFKVDTDVTGTIRAY